MKLIALKELRYAGRQLAAGEEFDASDRDGRLLTLIGKAEVAESAIGESEPEEVAPTTEQEQPKRRTYRRRDMRAED